MLALFSSVILLFLNCFLCSPAIDEIPGNVILNEFKDYPFMVSIKCTINGAHRCGGTILNPGWILTSAYCVANYLTSDFFIEYGDSTSKTQRKESNISEFIIHPDYDADAKDFVNDLALIKLENPIISDLVRPIKLAPNNLILPDYVQGIAIGWNMGSDNKPKHHEIMRVETITDRDCAQYYVGGINMTIICVENISYGKNFGIGDAGGPLIINNQQVGILSFTDVPDDFYQYPVGCTEISFYVDWIKRSISEYLQNFFDNYRL